MKTAGEPVAHRAEEFIVFPAAVAKNAVRQAFADGIEMQGAVAKSISEIVKGSRSAAPKRSAT
jgi:hypothetical protein